MKIGQAITATVYAIDRHRQLARRRRIAASPNGLTAARAKAAYWQLTPEQRQRLEYGTPRG